MAQLNAMYYRKRKPVLLADQYTGRQYTCYQEYWFTSITSTRYTGTDASLIETTTKTVVYP